MPITLLLRVLATIAVMELASLAVPLLAIARLLARQVDELRSMRIAMERLAR